MIGVRSRDIHNAALYERCSTSELKGRITQARWSLFGHVLRLARDTPAQLAMDYYVKVEDTGRKGRPVTTLPVALFNEYKKHSSIRLTRGARKHIYHATIKSPDVSRIKGVSRG